MNTHLVDFGARRAIDHIALALVSLRDVHLIEAKRMLTGALQSLDEILDRERTRDTEPPPADDAPDTLVDFNAPDLARQMARAGDAHLVKMVADADAEYAKGSPFDRDIYQQMIRILQLEGNEEFAPRRLEILIKQSERRRDQIARLTGRPLGAIE